MTGLPERLGIDGFYQALIDVATGLLLIALCAIVHEQRAATLTVTLCIVISSAIGRYRTSYALRPLDERYAVGGAACLAALALIVLIPVLVVPVWASLVTLVLWSCSAAAGAVKLTRARRARSDPPSGMCRYLDSRSRLRARDGVIRAAMRAADGVLATIGLVLLSPVILACGLAVYIEDRGSPIFTQTRVGLDGRPFVMYKFRTMRSDAGPEWVTPGDSRVTRVGAFLRRTSLDELPQLWNVMRGEMSLVGPRPEMVEFADRFATFIPNYHDRHAVSPGITGWAQIHCDRNFQPDDSIDVVPYDLFYVANYSLPLYMFCLVKTASEVMTHRAL